AGVAGLSDRENISRLECFAIKTAPSMFPKLSDGIIRSDAASNFHSGTGALGGFVQHVFRLPAHSQGRALKLRYRAANLKTLFIMSCTT
ncbi:hypothetical protein, partial [Bradyrhizobium sp. 190]|uniref:hypothetical protein n=1 Tax=Bradyrhizobium sp. 190 TaxID=2782658 RepID=UPI001FF827A8